MYLHTQILHTHTHICITYCTHMNAHHIYCLYLRILHHTYPVKLHSFIGKIFKLTWAKVYFFTVSFEKQWYPGKSNGARSR